MLPKFLFLENFPNWCMVEIMWHCRETRRKQRKQNLTCSIGRNRFNRLNQFNYQLKGGYHMYRITALTFLFVTLAIWPVCAQFISVFENKEKDIPFISTYCEIGKAAKKQQIKIVKSCDEYISQAQFVLKEATPTGSVKKKGEQNYLELKAKVRKFATPASACSRGIKTYIEIKGSKDNPLKLTKNLLVWQGVVYIDGEGNFFLSADTSYVLDDVKDKLSNQGSNR